MGASIKEVSVLLVGDSSGNDDEGMKRIGHRLAEALRRRSVQAEFVSLRRAVAVSAGSRVPRIIHFIAGPTWRTFVAAYALQAMQVTRPMSIITFIHPHWSRAADTMFRLFPPDAAIAQSPRWITLTESRVRTWTDPIVGVDLRRFSTVSEERKQRLRVDLGLSCDLKLLLHVGHLSAGRNLETLKRLAAPDRQILVIGSTTSKVDSRVLASLRESGISILREYVPNIHEYYQTADCYVFPTIDARACIEVPLSVLEALACGLPVVTTRFGGLPHFLKEGSPQLCYVNAESDFPRLVRSVLQMGRMEPLDVSKFDWDNVAAAMERVYGEALSG